MGRVAQTPLAAVGHLTPARRSAATTTHRLLVSWCYDRCLAGHTVEVTGGIALFSAAHQKVLVWLLSGVRPAGHRGAERLKRGMTGSKKRCPPADSSWTRGSRRAPWGKSSSAWIHTSGPPP
jgi:hypothetical protein